MSKRALVSVIVLAIALINQVLAALGIVPLDISKDTVYQIVSALTLIAGATSATWHNMSITPAAQAADVALKKLKAGEIDINAFIANVNMLADAAGNSKAGEVDE